MVLESQNVDTTYFIDAVLVQTNILHFEPLESLEYSHHQLFYKFRRNHDFRATCLVPPQLANLGSSVAPKVGTRIWEIWEINRPEMGFGTWAKCGQRNGNTSVNRNLFLPIVNHFLVV